MIDQVRRLGIAGSLLLCGALGACMPAPLPNTLDAEYNALNAAYPAATASHQIQIDRLKGAIQITVGSPLLFVSRGWQLSPGGEDILGKIAPTVGQFSNTHVVVIAYTDTTPPPLQVTREGVSTNDLLSQQQAQAVGDFFLAHGLNRALLSAVGRGDANPVAPNTTPAGRAQNRRVVITLAGTGT